MFATILATFTVPGRTSLCRIMESYKFCFDSPSTSSSLLSNQGLSATSWQVWTERGINEGVGEGGWIERLGERVGRENTRTMSQLWIKIPLVLLFNRFLILEAMKIEFWPREQNFPPGHMKSFAHSPQNPKPKAPSSRLLKPQGKSPRTHKQPRCGLDNFFLIWRIWFWII